MSHHEKEKQRGHDSLLSVGRRGVLSSCFGAALGLSLVSGSSSRAAILEADDDVDLLEKVKKDREKRLQKQGVISSSKKETGLCYISLLSASALLLLTVNSFC